ncbi:transposase [Streptomyces sp. NPDC058409]|uniref:transposase n=1 Tax=Streptomyces sp. NPDC058409 TaxID=3346484 RepID=UPI003663A144
MYDALNNGNVDVPRLRRVLAGLPQPKAADGRLVLAVDVTHWLRPDAPTSRDRLFCHVYGRSGRSRTSSCPAGPTRSSPRWSRAGPRGARSWTRCGWGRQTTSPRSPLPRSAGWLNIRRWQAGDRDILVVFDAGYDAPRMAYLLGRTAGGGVGADAHGPCDAQARPGPLDLAAEARQGVPLCQARYLGRA